MPIDSTTSFSLPVRFEPADITRIRRRASNEGMLASAWIREVCLSRATQQKFVPVPPPGERRSKKGRQIVGQVSVVFKRKPFDAIHRAAFRQRVAASTWIRAAVLEFLGA